MSIEYFPTYPKVSKDAVSVNLNSEFSMQIDQTVFDLYDQSKKKNGELAAYNQLIDFAENTLKVRARALDQLITAEKWFKKGIDLIHKYQRPYREIDSENIKDEDKKKIASLLKEYPKMQFEDFLKDYRNISVSMLAHMIYYINSNMEYFNKVTMVNLKETANELYKTILEFDKIHLLHERSNDLVELLSKKLVVEDLKRSDFVRTIEQIEKEVKGMPGPKIPQKLLADIEEVIIDLCTHKKEIAGNAYFRKDGSLNISQALRYALENPDFEKTWSNDSNPDGYSDRTLKKHFKNVYKKMKN